MMGHRGKMIDGDEMDAFTRKQRPRHSRRWRHGRLGKIKRRYNKRQRKAAKIQIEKRQVTHVQKCVICLAPATATVTIVFRNHFPLCLAHYEAYSQEAEQPSSSAELPPDKNKPILLALFVMALEKLDREMHQAEERRKEEMAEIDIYVTYHQGYYELWLGPECHALAEADLTTVFIPSHAAKIIAYKKLLSANSSAAVKFKHTYTAPDMSPEKLKPDQFRYIGLAEL